MEKIGLEVGIIFFYELKSAEEVVMVFRRPGGSVLLMTKSFYPEDVYRLPTGKMRDGESPDSAVIREIEEETGFVSMQPVCLGKVEYEFKCCAALANFTSHVYLISETKKWPEPKDEEEYISGFEEIPVSSLPEIAEELRNLAGKWSDWGKFRAIVHDFVYNKIQTGVE